MTTPAQASAFSPLHTTQSPSQSNDQAKENTLKRPNLSVRLAKTQKDLLLAQQLRAKTFGEEFNLSFDDGIDVDRFDSVCKHILVFSDDEQQLVATTRLMDRAAAEQVGQFYTQNEFDLTELINGFDGEILEVGRSCVHPDYRSMSAINTLWQGIGDVATKLGAKALLGCASIPIKNGDTQSWLLSLDDGVKITSYPKTALPKARSQATPKLPPLLKAYLRMGSLVGDKACFDSEFNCADVLIWFPFSRMDKRYLSRFAKNFKG